MPIHIQTTNLEETFRALRHNDPLKIQNMKSPGGDSYRPIPKNNLSPTATAYTGSGMTKMASGISYGQPQFFSPVHTNVNWQIPSKRLEQYQWSRFFYQNEPKVAAAIDFYAEFPMTNWEHECRNRKVKVYYDKMKNRLRLPYWSRLISHEVHLLGDCFVLSEIDCPHCHGTGRIGDHICEHEGGTIKRIVILNPDYVDVETAPFNPNPTILFRPDESLIHLVQSKGPGFEQLHPEVIKSIASGMPIRLDHRNVSHLKYGESGYSTYGVGMVRRLFPTLSYKTKLMVAQWIVAERLIVPIKVVKVGTDERPAGPADIASVQSQLQATANDPNVTIVTHHAFDLQWYGASGQVLEINSHMEFINQEILDGMMINNALLNGEGPGFSSAAVGIEAMIRRLKTFRETVSEWIGRDLYLPEAIRQDFTDINPDTEEEEYIFPTIKWENMHLRDQQQYRSNMITLYEKNVVSAQTLLEAFDLDPDVEIERKRYDAVNLMAMGQEEGAEGGMGGGFGGGGMPDLGGIGDMGGMGDMGGGDDMGGDAPISAPEGMEQTQMSSVDPSKYDGKILKKKTRAKIDSEKSKMYQNKGPSVQEVGKQEKNSTGPKMAYTDIEKTLMDGLIQHQRDGIINYPIVPQHPVSTGGNRYILDFAIPHLKIGIEADGEIFHSAPKQLASDKARDLKLNQQGWTIIRFKDSEIKSNLPGVMSTITKNIMKKEQLIKQQGLKSKNKG